MSDPTADPNTILYIDQCVEKWMPLIKDMAKDRQGFTSYLCEREVNYLQDRYGDASPLTWGPEGSSLKWIFPILTRVGDRIALGETEFARLFEAAEAVVDEMHSPVWCVGGMRDHGPPEELKTTVLPQLVERAHASLLDYAKIVG